MTAMARGWSICAPDPKARARGEHAGHGGQRGHDDGAETAAGGLDHGVVGVEASEAEALIGVEEENAVFSDDADHHNESHERRDVEGGSGDEEGEDDAGGGEDGGDEDGDGGGEVAELREEDAVDEDEGEEENL
jgi:hypothetical protein